MEEIIVDVSEKTSAANMTASCEVDKNFKMIFSGSVSNVKGDKNCYLLGQACNVPFCCHGCFNFSQEAFSAAWALRKVSKKETATMTGNIIEIEVFFKFGKILDCELQTGGSGDDCVRLSALTRHGPCQAFG